MTLNDEIVLVSVTSAEDADGYSSICETACTIPCDSSNGVTRLEFYEAYKAGIRLSAVFETWAANYDGQTIVEHRGKRYRVERSYVKDGIAQLNCSEVVR